ncbi:MAG: YerC/YecD family TrpR-related protein, partial [Syntrophothermus sp.]
TYNDVVARTGASTATVSRVKRCLNYGADGYQLVLARMRK